jgi:SprT protein
MSSDSTKSVMNQTKIIELVQKYSKKVQQKYPEFKEPKVEFFNTTKCAGKAYYLSHKVSFNTVLAKDNPDEFENTISHEIAHLVTKMIYPNAKQHHGPEFKKVHQWLGGTGSTYHQYDTSGVKVRKVKTYTYVCMCQKHKVSAKLHSLVKQGNMYKCASCGQCIKFDN